MTSYEERLVASDPVPSGSYVPARYGEMLSRVTAHRVTPRDSFWPVFRARVAAAVAATGLVTGVGIAALGNAGGALSVLGFAAPTHAKAAQSMAATGYFAILRPDVTWQFTGGDAFSHEAASATVYSLSAPSDGAASLERVASVFGLDVGAPTSGDAGQSYSASGPDYSGWLVQNGGYASWGLDASSSGSVVSTPSTPDVAPSTFNDRAVGFVRALGDYALGAPSASGVTSGPGGSDEVYVTIPVLTQGRATEFSFTVAFAPDGTVLHASGPLFTARSVATYPIISPADAVNQITAQLGLTTSFVGEGGGVVATQDNPAPPSSTPPGGATTPPSAPGDAGSSPGSPPPASGGETTTTVPAPTLVTLTDVTLEYGVFAMANGDTMLLPVYVFTGTVAGEGGGYQVSFRVVPIDPAYLDLSTIRATSP